ncbi:hypothetical protein HRbin20_00114 [bacterium HR20]|nr:hypothetical protein HRbin20_00114 [bacterium HR20]
MAFIVVETPYKSNAAPPCSGRSPTNTPRDETFEIHSLTHCPSRFLCRLDRRSARHIIDPTLREA